MGEKLSQDVQEGFWADEPGLLGTVRPFIAACKANSFLDLAWVRKSFKVVTRRSSFPINSNAFHWPFSFVMSAGSSLRWG
jgi:hypothetical protein